MSLSNNFAAIYDTDDDNFPYNHWSFPPFEKVRLELIKEKMFFNVYSKFCDGLVWARGYPLDQINNQDSWKEEMRIVDVGVWQGLADQDPDIDAIHCLVFNNEMAQVKAMLKRLLKLKGDTLQLVYFVYDGAFGNNAAVQMTRQVGLQLISKLRNNSALYFKYNGAYSGKGRRRIYGNRIDCDNLPEKNLHSDTTKKLIRTRTYQLEVIHKKFADPLSVVIIIKENQKTGQKARVILFSADLDLNWDKQVDYYRLRFQIEFNFRDARQHWGLEDFMVVKEQSVFNAANLSLFMVNVSQAMLATSEDKSILDLKARHLGLRYVQEVFKILPENTRPINIMQLFKEIPVLGRIHEEKLAA